MEISTHVPPRSSHSATLPELRDVLEHASRGERLGHLEALALLDPENGPLEPILQAASQLRDEGKGRTVTYSPKVFLPITNLCRDRCSYCTFRKDPGDEGTWTMTPDEVRDWSGRGRELGCREALLCLGDRPEAAFRQYRALMGLLGFESTIDYVARCCEASLEAGLWPHTNAGVMTFDELRFLKPFNVSMGLMLENVSPRLRARGGPHAAAPDKDPIVRLRTLRDAGRLRIAFTTGILIGIGETLEERAESLLALREINDEYGHIQEVIVQNFRAKPTIPMAESPEPDDREMARTVATARLVFGPRMNLQAPPNLSPNGHRLLLRAGINDWGGISPLTRDYVNPEAPWPHVIRLAETCAAEGFELRPRLPVYSEFAEKDGFLDSRMREGVLAELSEREIPGCDQWLSRLH